MEVGKTQEARKAALSLPEAPWKGTSFSGTCGSIYVQSVSCRQTFMEGPLGALPWEQVSTGVAHCQ